MTDRFEKLRGKWTSALGVNGSQWLILIALADLDKEGQGVRAATISKYLQINITYIVIESRKLEKNGFLYVCEIAGAVQISLTVKSQALIATLGVT